MPTILLYTTGTCPYCKAAKDLLARRGVENYTEIRVDAEPGERATMEARSGGRRTVPQIFIGDRHVGGFDDLSAADRKGDLVKWLQDS